MCFNVVTIVLMCTCDVTTPLTVHVMPIVQCATAESANPSAPREKKQSHYGGGAPGIT